MYFSTTVEEYCSSEVENYPMTLTQAAVLTRRSIIILGVLILLGISTKVGLDWYANYQLSKLPPIEEKAEMSFGGLPDPEFPSSKVSSSNFSYSIDTATGELPEFPRLVKVYFIPKATLSLLAPDRAKSVANKLGFNNGPQIVSTENYIFTDDNRDHLR
jgi:hypothetical protein